MMASKIALILRSSIPLTVEYVHQRAKKEYRLFLLETFGCKQTLAPFAKGALEPCSYNSLLEAAESAAEAMHFTKDADDETPIACIE